MLFTHDTNKVAVNIISRNYSETWGSKLARICVCIYLPLQRSHSWSLRRTSDRNEVLIPRDCHQRCNHKISMCVSACLPMRFRGFVPGNDENGSCTGLNSPRADSTGGLNAGSRTHSHTVNVYVDAYCTALPSFCSHIHQHHSISKVQSSVICDTEINLNTSADSGISTVVVFCLNYNIVLKRSVD